MSQTLIIPQPAWQVIYNGTDVTRHIEDSVTEVTYTEEVGGKANGIEIRIDDSLRVWQKVATDQLQGASIALSIGYAGAALVPCGTFQFDERTLEGPPDTFLIHAIQAPVSAPLRTRNTVAYEGTTLIGVANTIAARHSLTVVSEAVSPDVTLQRVTQKHEEDLAFLARIAAEHGYELQVRNSQLIFYSRNALETASISATIVRTALTRFRLIDQILGHQTYKAAQVTYFDPRTKTLIQGQASDSSAPSSDTLKVVGRCESNQHAALKAASHLHHHNKKKCTTELELPGTMQYRAGQRVKIKGWGTFDDNDYLVQRARHQLSREGWRTSLSLETNVQQSGATGGTQSVASDVVSDNES